MSRAIIPHEMLAGEYLFKRYGATVEDYERAADEDSRLELLDGVLLMHSPANVGHEDCFAFLLGLLRAFVSPLRLGRVFGSRTPMVLDDERRFEPDLLFIKTENLHRLGEVELRGPADLVIEILSPATREYDLGEKRRAYAEGGVPEYWIVDPRERVVLIDRPAGQRVAERSNGFVSPAAIPEFQLEASWLWQGPLPEPSECLARMLGTQ